MDTVSPESGGMILRPVGIVRNSVQEPFLVAGKDGISARDGPETGRNHARIAKEAASEIIIDENRTALLDGIEGYSHITVLYWGHRVPEESRLVDRVHPMGRTDIPKTGIFSTCSPARPNPVLTTVVRLHARQENALFVTGLDAVDGSPIIDIKPYVPSQYPRDTIRVPAWMERLMNELGERRE